MTLENLANTLCEHPFLQGFAAEHIDKLAAMASEVRFGKGALIFREGDESSFFYLLLAGKVALETNAPGRIVRIVTLGPGEELGWSSELRAIANNFKREAWKRRGRWLSTGSGCSTPARRIAASDSL